MLVVIFWRLHGVRMKNTLSLEEYTDDELEAIKRVNRGEPLRDKIPKNYSSFQRIKPIFHHPLPLSRHRFPQEKMLREVSTHAANRQALTAVTLRNPWVLEDVLMRGAPVDVQDKNGYTPLHIACSQNDFECAMVLINVRLVFLWILICLMIVWCQC